LEEKKFDFSLEKLNGYISSTLSSKIECPIVY